MAQKLRITEEKLKQLIKEAVVSELSSNYINNVKNSYSERTPSGFDEHGNSIISRSNGREELLSDIMRRLNKYEEDSLRNETNSGDLSTEARSIWDREGLEGDIDWETSDWVSSRDETYGPCFGSVTSDEGWVFEVPGFQEGDSSEIDNSEPIEFETPDGQKGSFYL